MDASSQNLPQESDAQRIGHFAERSLNAAHPESWRPTRLDGTDDFGFDYQVQTVVDGYVRDIFRAQLKGTTSPEWNADGTFLSIPLKTSTVRYYERVTEPVLLILCDLSAGTAPTQASLYYCWIEEELRRINAAQLPDEQHYVTFRVPTDNRLTLDTDLSEHLDNYRSVSKAARAIEAFVEVSSPDLSARARANLVSRIPAGFEARSFSLLQEIAEPATTPWPEAPENTFAWHLKEAGQHLRAGDAEEAQSKLEAASSLGVSPTKLELAEHLYLTGRVHALLGNDDLARDCYEKAAGEAGNLPRYAAPWLESELRVRHLDGSSNFDDLIAAADGTDTAIRSIRSRLLAAAGRPAEGLAIAETISGHERHAAKAIIHTMTASSEEALNDCDAGLAEPGVPERSRILFLILRARARFRQALSQCFANSESNTLPLSGPAGTDISRLRCAWIDIEAAVALLRKQGWPPNTVFIADIWSSAATILGRSKETLPLVKEAARARPNLQTLQSALESLAVDTGDLRTALGANARLPQNSDTLLRRVALLHNCEQHPECVELFASSQSTLDQEDSNYPNVVASAVLSADKIVKTNLADNWANLLQQRPQWAPQSSLLSYFRRVSASPLEREDALDALIVECEALKFPPTMAMMVLNELDPSTDSQASSYLRIADSVFAESLLPVDLSTKYAYALGTKEDWVELLRFASDCIERFGSTTKFAAFRALALDRLGSTPEAIAQLNDLLNLSDIDSFAIETYVAIATRCGMTDEAIGSVENLLSLTTHPERRLECLRWLFSLLYTSDPTDSRCVSVALRIGEQSRPDIEQEEGLFLVTMLAATLYAPLEESDPRLSVFRKRLHEFTHTFPESLILRYAWLPKNASPDDLLQMMKKISGYDDKRETWRRSIETQLQRGLVPIPYAWRPRIILNNIPDVPTLWELAKRSSNGQQELHLQMSTDEWEPVSLAAMRGHIPLLDLTTIQVVHDLELFDLLFLLFPEVAIGQRTLVELTQHSSPMFGSFVREKCLAIQSVLKANVYRIRQPLAEIDDETIQEQLRPLEEIEWLAKNSAYLVYSDDALFRIYCDPPSSPKYLCSLDILSALDEGGWLSPQEVSEKLANLCRWHVGIAVTMRYQLAALPDGLAAVSNVQDGVATLRGSEVSSAIFNGIWGGSKPYAELQTQAGQLLRTLVSVPTNSTSSIASLMALWHEKARLRSDAPTPPLRVAVLLVLQAASIDDPPSPEESTRMWAVYRLLVENEFGDRMDEKRELEAIALAGKVAADIDVKNSLTPPKSLYSRLVAGLTEGTKDEEVFASAYSTERVEKAARTDE